jgi:carboxypeptidase Q
MFVILMALGKIKKLLSLGTNLLFVLLIIYISVTNVDAVVRRNANSRFAIKSGPKWAKVFNNSRTAGLPKYVSRDECNLSDDLTKEIARYKPIVEGIINASVNGVFKRRTWRTLARFVDTFGSRIAGSDNLEKSIDYMVDLLKKNQLENVHTEPALVPKWVRGRESCWLISPRLEKLNILGLGSSIGTPPKGITAHAIVVESFVELQNIGKEVRICLLYEKSTHNSITNLNVYSLQAVEGKIVVYNEPYVSYEKTVKYRGYGAIEAAKLGAVATLIRSVTPFSIDSPVSREQSC